MAPCEADLTLRSCRNAVSSTSLRTSSLNSKARSTRSCASYRLMAPDSLSKLFCNHLLPNTSTEAAERMNMNMAKILVLACLLYVAETSTADFLHSFNTSSVSSAFNTTAICAASEEWTCSYLYVNCNDSSWQDFECLREWLLYDSATSVSLQIFSSNATSSRFSTYYRTYGTGQVYRTTDGIPVASGNFTPTKVITTVLPRVYTTVDYETITAAAVWPTSSPLCSSLDSFQRNCLCDIYYHSMGLIRNGTTVTDETISFDSTMCPFRYSSCSTESLTSGPDPLPCYLEGGTVQLFYFPPQTQQHSTEEPITEPEVVTSDNVTFTSPTIYLSFDYLTAFTLHSVPQVTCTSCRWQSCLIQLQLMGFPLILATVGTEIYNTLLSEPPHIASEPPKHTVRR